MSFWLIYSPYSFFFFFLSNANLNVIIIIVKSFRGYSSCEAAGKNDLRTWRFGQIFPELLNTKSVT